MAYEPIAAPVHSAAKRLWFNNALKPTRSAPGDWSAALAA